jgi:hypothetical protein
MATVDELFDQFRAAYGAGEDADPRRFLDRVSGLERRELEALIDGFLSQDPGRAYDEAAFERFGEDPLRLSVRSRVEERLGLAEDWTTLLKRARTEARIPRSTLVTRLAAALGVQAQERKVRDYYHQMELGVLPPRGVSDRVLEALGRIVGVPVERLRAAGERLAPPGAGAGGPVFARTAASHPVPAPAASPRMRSPEETWDEVDRLFRGGPG